MAVLTAYPKINSIIASECMTLESFNEESLTALIAEHLYALRVPNFLAQECEQLALWCTQHPKSQNYTHEVYVDGNPIQIDIAVTR